MGWHYTVYCYDLDDVFMTWFMDYIWLYIYNYILWYVKYVMVHESRELTLLTRLTSRYQLWIPFLPSPPRTPCWASRSPPAALRRCSGRRPRWVQRRAWAARRHLGTSEVISERFWKYLKDCRKSRVFVGSLNIPSFSGWTMENRHFFPRAYERRVLPIVGVCKTSFHLLIFTSSHLRIFSSSHPHIFTSSHLHIFLSSDPHIFTSSHLHICSSSHLLILTSSHLLIFTSSHLHILTSSHLLIFTSAHPLILTSSHPHILTSSHPHITSHLHIFTSSHLHICSSSHLHIFTSSHLLMLTSSHLHIFSSCPLALLPSPSILFEGAGQGQCQRDGTKRNRFARNEVRSSKTEVKLRFQGVPRSPFARNEVRSPKTAVKLRF